MTHQPTKTVHPLVKAIDEFAAEFELKPSYVGQCATSDSGLYARLRGGGWCSPRVKDRVDAWIESETKRRREQAA